MTEKLIYGHYYNFSLALLVLVVLVLVFADSQDTIIFPPGNSAAIKIIDHSIACNATTVGTLRYRDLKLQICNGTDYVNVCGEDGDSGQVGSEVNPAESCLEIMGKRKNVPSGVYHLKNNNVVYKTFCMMEDTCGSRGWTLIMKIDGAKPTFHYTSELWHNEETYNNEDAGVSGGLDHQQTKLQSYMHFPFTILCLGMRVADELKWINLMFNASSLYSVIADGNFKQTDLGREKWRSLINGSSLQHFCNREGFNVREKDYGTMARIGILGNDNDNCQSPESRLGFGTSGYQCLQDDSNTAGNDARCYAEDGDKNIKGFGYIFAQSHLVNETLGFEVNPARSCKEIKEVKIFSPNGMYYIKLNGVSTQVYCHMDMICVSSGWTLLMKIDGNQETFKYQSTYWTNKDTYNPEAVSGGLDDQETKLKTFSDFAFTSLCLGMKTNTVLNWLKLPCNASSLYSITSENDYKATSLGRDAWKSLIPDSSLQLNCNREGFNVQEGNTRARIGIVTNNQNDCRTPDSRLGFGTTGNRCGQDPSNTAGNEAQCSGTDNGEKSIKATGYILAQ